MHTQEEMEGEGRGRVGLRGPERMERPASMLEPLTELSRPQSPLGPPAGRWGGLVSTQARSSTQGPTPPDLCHSALFYGPMNFSVRWHREACRPSTGLGITQVGRGLAGCPGPPGVLRPQARLGSAPSTAPEAPEAPMASGSVGQRPGCDKTA